MKLFRNSRAWLPNSTVERTSVTPIRPSSNTFSNGSRNAESDNRMKYEALMTIQRGTVKTVQFLMTISKSCPFAPASILNARGKNESQLGGRRRRHPNPGTKHKNRALLLLQSLFWRDWKRREGGRTTRKTKPGYKGREGGSKGGRTDAAAENEKT